jgi:hypothetical protein
VLSYKDLVADPAYLCARTTARGHERFSFPQAVTLYPGVCMRTRPHWCPELETLAVNLLLHAKPAWQGMKDPVLARRVTRSFAKAFALEFLAPVAGHSWALTVETVMEALSYLDANTHHRPGARDD